LPTVWHVICSAMTMSWWLGFRIRGGWLVQELPPAREKSVRDTRDKIPGDLSSQEWRRSGLCQFQSLKIVELAMDALSARPKAESVATMLFAERGAGRSVEITIPDSDGRPS